MTYLFHQTSPSTIPTRSPSSRTWWRTTTTSVRWSRRPCRARGSARSSASLWKTRKWCRNTSHLLGREIKKTVVAENQCFVLLFFLLYWVPRSRSRTQVLLYRCVAVISCSGSSGPSTRWETGPSPTPWRACASSSFSSPTTALLKSRPSECPFAILFFICHVRQRKTFRSHGHGWLWGCKEHETPVCRKKKN